MPLLRILAVACLCLAGACAADPPRTDSTPPPAAGADVDPGRVHELEQLTTRPVLANIQQLGELLAREYPPALRRAGHRGQATATLVIDERGRVAAAQISQSSGVPELDAATLRVARELRFRPGRIGGTPVRVRLELPIQWTMN